MKLLDEVRHVARLRRLALETERCYVRWVEQYIRFHKTPAGFRHPNTMGGEEVEHFLTFLAVQRRVSASTQNQAFAALLFLYRDVLHLDLGALDALRARRSRRLPVVLTREEAALLLAGLDALPTREPYGLMARLMYSAGLRLMECCRLRVKDVDFRARSSPPAGAVAGASAGGRCDRRWQRRSQNQRQAATSAVRPCQNRLCQLRARGGAVAAHVSAGGGPTPPTSSLAPARL